MVGKMRGSEVAAMRKGWSLFARRGVRPRDLAGKQNIGRIDHSTTVYSLNNGRHSTYFLTIELTY